jgi:hypothetical protein
MSGLPVERRCASRHSASTFTIDEPIRDVAVKASAGDPRPVRAPGAEGWAGKAHALIDLVLDQAIISKKQRLLMRGSHCLGSFQSCMSGQEFTLRKI